MEARRREDGRSNIKNVEAHSVKKTTDEARFITVAERRKMKWSNRNQNV